MRSVDECRPDLDLDEIQLDCAFALSADTLTTFPLPEALWQVGISWPWSSCYLSMHSMPNDSCSASVHGRQRKQFYIGACVRELPSGKMPLLGQLKNACRLGVTHREATSAHVQAR